MLVDPRFGKCHSNCAKVYNRLLPCQAYTGVSVVRTSIDKLSNCNDLPYL